MKNLQIRDLNESEVLAEKKLRKITGGYAGTNQRKTMVEGRHAQGSIMDSGDSNEGGGHEHDSSCTGYELNGQSIRLVNKCMGLS